jgi:phosphatidylserine decarboxylase
MIYNRATRQLEDDPAFGSSALNLLYTTVWGRVLLRLATSAVVSNAYAALNDTKRSAEKIERFIAEWRIDASEFAQEDFPSFNAFFTRRLKPQVRPIDSQPQHLIAVADAKLLAFPLDENAAIAVKHTIFTAGSLIGAEEFAKAYCGGLCLVFRLTMDDCHRYAYPDAGTLLWSREIAGRLHSVQPIAQRAYRVFHENKRHVSMLATQTLGEVVQVEVGALLTGGIHNNGQHSFARGEEKGYFELGGSTVILLLKQGVARIDSDIAEQSRQGIETKVKLGERIGEVLPGA